MKEKIINEYPNSKFQLLNSKVQTLTSNQRAITLIALVVTIIVLLILAGVTINIVFSDNGIIKRAQSVGATQKNAEIMEKLELIKANLEITKRVDGKITEQDYFNGLKDAGIISDPNIGGDNIKELPEEDGKKKYEVITDDGEVLEIEFPKDKDEWPGGIKVEYVGTGENLPPSIRIKNTLASTNSITLEVEVTRIEAGDKISYYYKKHTDTAYTTFKENVTDQTINIEGLEQGQTYIIKIVASNANGQTTKETQGIPLGELEEGTISILSGPTWVGDGTATLELQTSATVGYMEYKIVPKVQTRQIDDDDTEWTKYTGPITGLRHNNIVLARLSDGINATVYEYPVEIIDEDDPMPATGIDSLNSIEMTVEEEKIITVGLSDLQSGINLSESKWIFNTTSTPVEVTSMVWQSANEFTNGQQVTISSTTDGIYYLHILSTDNAENKTVTMAGPVMVNKLEEYYLVDKVSQGDYVAYDAGSWTTTVSSPNSNASFGGYTSGTNKGTSVNSYSNSYKAPTDGWRVFSKSGSGETGIVTLISAGTPAQGYYGNSTANRTTMITELNNFANLNFVNSEYASLAASVTYDNINSLPTTSGGLRNINSYYWVATEGETGFERKKSGTLVGNGYVWDNSVSENLRHGYDSYYSNYKDTYYYLLKQVGNTGNFLTSSYVRQILMSNSAYTR